MRTNQGNPPFSMAKRTFRFPADTGVDASWLMGSEFAAKAELGFGTETTGSFVLRPHVHREKAE